MRRCPKCDREFPDKYNFCQFDRTPLTEVSGSESPSQGHLAALPFQAAWGQADPGSRSFNLTSRHIPFIVAAATIALLGMAIVSYLYLSTSKPDQTVLASTVNTNVASYTAPPSPTAARPSTSSIEEDVKATLNNWAAATNAHDLDTHMSYYADTLDYYYDRKNARIDFVRTGRERAYNKYPQLNVQLSNITVAPSTSGMSASATFDKTWDFQGEKHSTGSVRQMVELTNVGGRWLITAEKDLQTYYANW